MPGWHSLFWKLIVGLALFCLLTVSMHLDLEQRVYDSMSTLSTSSRGELTEFAREAETAWREQGRIGLDTYLQDLHQRERVWVVVVDEQHRSLSSLPLSEEEALRLSFVRRLDQKVGRPGGQPVFYVPFSDGDGRLVMELPRRLDPRNYSPLWDVFLRSVLPASLAILLGTLLYRWLIAPLVILRRQANNLSAGDLSARVGAPVASRQDELGELGRAFDHMAERLQGTVVYQRRLLRDLSHELRTPLSRLRVASDGESDPQVLRQRLDREITIMQTLVENSLELAWLDSERPQFAREPIRVLQLWDMLVEDACFEAGWPSERLLFEVDEDCTVYANLTSLAQALENLLRNAIRHSPPAGTVRLSGVREGDCWHLRLVDDGPGVDERYLETIFEPFSRLDCARPGDGGFGLGLSIARSAIALQGGRLWAQSPPGSGLQMHLALPAAEVPEQSV
ncbi:two-component sensor histidine kinase [Pseudomonas sp. PA15(2017)]|uniref:sensor histidine kinase n=1 Tax=Pseudomonas sp. PA15(2017) TaxID=1932111 RepID=UPI00096794CF|nr:sensor histidine kinase [Pseudomonas sp. PA15(2017)]OLU28765.1 two-component sensor histidine kinase [Pseudomonas sp. PA15(2017)]